MDKDFIGFIVLMILFIGGIATLVTEQDEVDEIRDGNCLIIEKEHRSISFDNYTTVETLCREK